MYNDQIGIVDNVLPNSGCGRRRSAAQSHRWGTTVGVGGWFDHKPVEELRPFGSDRSSIVQKRRIVPPAFRNRTFSAMWSA